jgi:hypothetical protein
MCSLVVGVSPQKMQYFEARAMPSQMENIDEEQR